MVVQHLAMVSDEPTKASAGYHMTRNLDPGDPAFHAFVQDPKNAHLWHAYYQRQYFHSAKRGTETSKGVLSKDEAEFQAQQSAADTEC